MPSRNLESISSVQQVQRRRHGPRHASMNLGVLDYPADARARSATPSSGQVSRSWSSWAPRKMPT